MRHPRATFPMLLAAVIGCEVEPGPALTDVTSLAQVVGTWTATRSQFTVIDDTTQSVDLIADGWAFVIVIGSDGSYRWEVEEMGELAEVFQGTVEVGTGTLAFHPVGVTDPPAIIRPTFDAYIRDGELLLIGETTVRAGDFGFETGMLVIPLRCEMDLRRQ